MADNYKEALKALGLTPKQEEPVMTPELAPEDMMSKMTEEQQQDLLNPTPDTQSPMGELREFERNMSPQSAIEDVRKRSEASKGNVSSIDKMKADLQNLMQGGGKDMDEAKRKDMITNLMSGLNQALGRFDQAAASRGSGQAQKMMEQQQFKSNFAGELKGEQQESYKKLMDKLNLERQANKDMLTDDYMKAQIRAMDAKAETAGQPSVMEQIRRDGELRRVEAQKEKLEKQDRDQVERYTKKVEASGQYKDSEKMINNIETVESLIKEAGVRGGQSLAMLGPRVAKGIAGEVGVLTEQDVTRYVQSPDLVGSARDTLLKVKDGKLSDVSAENLNSLVDIMKNKAIIERAKAYDRGATQLSRNSGLSYEQAREYLDPDYVIGQDKLPKEQEAKVEFSPAQEMGIQSVMDKNKVDREVAIKALKKAGKL